MNFIKASTMFVFIYLAILLSVNKTTANKFFEFVFAY